MAADVVVRHCTLTVHGRGGWGWGSDCSGYLADAIPWIEQALARVVDECDLDPTTEVHVHEPMVVRWLPDGTLPDDVRHTLVGMVRRAAEAPDASGPSSVAGPAAPVQQHPAAEPAAVPPPAPPSEPSGALTDLLTAWSASGRLPQIVAGWPAGVVAQWVRTVRRIGDRTAATELAPPACRAIAAVVLNAEQWPGDRGRVEDRLLVLVAALIAAAGGRPIGPATFESAVALATPGAVGRQSSIDAPWPEAAGAQTAPAAEPAPAETGAELNRRASADLSWPVVVPGLPFLVIVQLSRIGYLDALVAVAEAAKVPVATRLVAAGLAGKVLTPPARGWRRESAEARAVAAAAHLPRQEVDIVAERWRADAEGLVAPLTSALAALYAAGRSSADEVVVTTTEHGVVCGEAVGALPIAWLPDLPSIDAVLDQLGRPPTLHSELFLPLVRDLAARSAFPHVDLPGLELHVGAAVGAALGSLAHDLWGTDSADAPMLAIERLGDLEVQLRTDDTLEVAVPKGQRWMDLGRAGLMDRWAVPWCPAGYWELVSW